MKSPAPKHTRSTPSLKHQFPVVGIGASAGGLDAFTRLLRNLSTDTGMAFVLIQHLDPVHKSMLTEILSRETQMPVHEATHQMRVQPNHVYVTPPNVQMSLRNNVLHLVPRDSGRGGHMPIDFFLNSLAVDKGPHAIAVILSGADGDGAHALNAIKAEGGIAMAQDATSAKFGAMPAHAVETGLADFVLPPEKIAQELLRIARRPPSKTIIRIAEDTPEPGTEAALSKIYFFLRRDRGVDFTHYKQTTIRRRIQRRMLVHNVNRLEDYVKILKTHPKEVGVLYDDLLIHVTSFFRDPEVFAGLKKKIFPRLFKHHKGLEEIRIWVPGCATGEEVYSIAIALWEYLGSHAAQTPIHIFATDISESSLQKARAGIYSTASLKNVSAEQLRRFFTPVTGGHQIQKALRQLCIFSKQNVAKDPPFSRLDLISCRNLMIYLGPALQKKVLPIFHFALKPAGLLLLGTSETLSNTDLFNPFDKKTKFYSKGVMSARQHALFSSTDYPAEVVSRNLPQGPDADNGLSLQKEADQHVLTKRAPSGVIVDGAMNIVQFRGNTSPYLELAPGAATFQLFKLTKEGLLSGLRQALHKAKKDNAPAKSEEARINQKGAIKNITIEVVPLRLAPAQGPHYLILFEETLPLISPKAKSGPLGKARVSASALHEAQQETVRLKKELAAAKDFLQSVIDEHDRVVQELESANEEAQSSNEEFQSTNEELETAKEELQATNEETTTLNDDLQNRNVELNQLNNDLLNLSNSISIPTIILGKDHHIRRLTSSAERILHLTGSDIGRSIHDLRLTITVVDLKQLIDKVLQSLVPEALDIQDVGGHWYHLRIQLYRTTEDTIDGVVLSFTDIQLAKEHQEAVASWTATLEKRVKERTEELAQSQAALLQAEKLEAIGRLAGGVAHDFNNLMSGILLITQDVIDHLGPSNPQAEDLRDVLVAARKAMDITRQLLAFGRRQVLAPQVININEVIQSTEKLLGRLIGKEIDLITVLDPQLGNLELDPGVIEQIVLNLALNARDAMPKGGKITIQTGHATIAKDEGVKVAPGSYVVLTVSDEGAGISPEILPHIFEPFFSTKRAGKGTGLGLATVYGIVKQCGGNITIDSQVGQGTTFQIYLPYKQHTGRVERRATASRIARGGSETILVAEDEGILRKAIVRTLRKKGYTVLQARGGSRAIKICQSYPKPIHLLLTDVIMPGMNGRELAASVHKKRPGMSILYMSGHTRGVIAQREIIKPGVDFVEKSFSSEGLCQKVREVLDKRKKNKKGA